MKSRVQAQAASKSVSPRSAFSGTAFWIALFAVVAVFGLSSVPLSAQSAASFFKHGQTAEAKEDYDAAFSNYQKAYNKAPKDLRYRAYLYRVRTTAASVHVTRGQKLLDAGNEQGALAEFLRATEIDPSNEAALQDIARVRQKHGEVTPVNETSLPVAPGKQEALDSMSAPAVLRPVSDEPLTLHMQEDAKVVYQAVGKAAGINVLFDPEFASKRVQVDLNSVSLLDALRIVGTISNTFWRPVTENTIFVAANTRARHTELDEQAVQTFYLSNAWQQNDLTDVQTAIRNVLPNAKVYAVASQNAIVMRATPDELLLAEKLINDLDKARPEVVVDIAVLEVSKNWEKTLGIAWPSSVGVSLQQNSTSTTSGSSTSTCSSSNTSACVTLYNLAHLKASNFAVTVGSATANLLLTDSDTKILQNPRIRATDGQKAIMKIGSKIPVATGSYQTGASTSSVSSLVNTQFQYQDVGVNVEMTPTVHFDRDVTLKIKIEVTSHSGDQTISGVTEPIISQRTVDQVIRLREGEASILGGIQDNQETASWNGIPGLSSIPIMKYLFGSKDRTIKDDELVFLVVPHVVRSQSLEQVNLRTVDTGEGTSIQLRQISGDSTNSASKPSSKPALNPAVIPAPPRPPANAQPNVGTVPGESAMAAAPGALKLLSQAAETTGNTATATPLSAAQQPAATPQSAATPAKVSFTLTRQPGPVASGTSFPVSVVLNGGTSIAAVPLQISYDPVRLSLVNIDSGNFLSSDGQAVALVHRDDGPGSINVVASRPPGATGVSGTGVVCVLTFQAKAAGDGFIAITRPGAVSSTQQQLPATGAQISIQVK